MARGSTQHIAGGSTWHAGAPGFPDESYAAAKDVTSGLEEERTELRHFEMVDMWEVS